jgi:hypothetical protein
MATLPRDANGQRVQGVAKLGTVHNVAISTVSAKNTTAFKSDTIRVCATTNCWWTAGNAPITATAGHHFLPGGVIEYYWLDGATNLATIGGGAGTMYIDEVL